MILYDLRCANDHLFEAWFRDSAAFETQAAAHEVVCPNCGDTDVVKAPMAPRIARQRGSGDRRGSDDGREADEAGARFDELRQHVEENCDYVGERFAEEARKIHYGETESRGIYGEASSEEARDLSEEGVEFQRVPWPKPTDA